MHMPFAWQASTTVEIFDVDRAMLNHTCISEWFT